MAGGREGGRTPTNSSVGVEPLLPAFDIRRPYLLAECLRSTGAVPAMRQHHSTNKHCMASLCAFGDLNGGENE